MLFSGDCVIRSDLTKFLGSTVGLLTKKSSEKSNAPHMPHICPGSVPPAHLGFNIDRCIRSGHQGDLSFSEQCLVENIQGVAKKLSGNSNF